MLLPTHVSALVALLPIIAATPIHPPGDDIDVSNRYIITLHPTANLTSHLSHVETLHLQTAAQQFEGLTHQYTISSYQAYAGHFPPSLITTLKPHPDIASIEPDTIHTLTALTKQDKAPYNLPLISHRGGGPDQSYWYDDTAGSGTYAYVIDSGIKISHLDFEHRASLGYTSLKNITHDDRAGHGTHVAGIIGSKTYGVAKKCNLISVKAFNYQYSSTATILDAYNWAVNDIITKKRQGKAVINTASSGPYSKAFNTAVDTAFSKGVTTVTGSGNDGQPARSVSPASADGAITVAATDSKRTRASFSGWGPSVTLFAPGVDIMSTWIGPETTEERTGTSMAAAHVAGVVLGLKKVRKLPDAKSTLEAVKQLATKDLVGQPKGGHNLFCYNGSGK
ncbi:subtilisin-like protein [Myriangium duriaei CBS 260.36]|uniref:Subtilisin-like protein n=1 Tax=Myriangium duriaei CBS 260.36 TaxID=1168546 RepID=A0A9P4IZU3_9PEZI|nr:subtilisin-like protein [Myriangium duriaei CBS 260.36]